MTKKIKRAPYGITFTPAPKHDLAYESRYGVPLYNDVKKSVEETLEIIENDVARHNAEHAEMIGYLQDMNIRTGEILAILKNDVPKSMMVGVYPKPVEGNTELLWEEE